ncbi:GNAT family N-acetyltransferase [Paenibacillus sp. DMB20]|uniref:GNAT family N-acetyltransferase n=1 Tax=Paenibacillus sp. DMB20 TaxID=1642570 RepID=UPI0006278FFD|nr:N-acetyltransferase [Paenibacillus sp. DMB20]KKO53242.1 GNAT family acetyltransferase [Paenibacillus sp. DMB20]
MRPSVSIAKLTKADKPLFVALMSRAFARDPLFLHVFGDSELDDRAQDHVIAFLAFMFDKSLLLNEEVWGYFEKENLLGVYIVEKPQASMIHKVKGFGLILRLIPLFFQLSRKTLSLLNSYMRVTRSFAPSRSHHYLVMIGVEPKAQGKGIGKALLRHLLDTVEADNGSHGIALDTENEANVNLYRRFGFSLTMETQIGNIPVYCMFYQKNEASPGDSASVL